MPYHYAAVFDYLKYEGYDPFGREYAEAQCLPLFTLSAEGDFEIIDQPCSSEQDYHESEQWEVVSEDSEVREPRQSDVPLRHNHVAECTVVKNGCSTLVPRRHKRLLRRTQSLSAFDRSDTVQEPVFNRREQKAREGASQGVSVSLIDLMMEFEEARMENHQRVPMDHPEKC